MPILTKIDDFLYKKKGTVIIQVIFFITYEFSTCSLWNSANNSRNLLQILMGHKLIMAENKTKTTRRRKNGNNNDLLNAINN